MSRVPRWPALPEMVAKQLELIQAEGAEAEEGDTDERVDYATGEVTESAVTRPWNLGELGGGEFEDAVFSWLDRVVLWHNAVYGWQEHQLIPACWQQHPGLAMDLAALAFGRLDVYATATPKFVITWHGDWEEFQKRMSFAFGENDGRDCLNGKHSVPADYTRAGVKEAIDKRRAEAD